MKKVKQIVKNIRWMMNNDLSRNIRINQTVVVKGADLSVMLGRSNRGGSRQA